MPEADRAFDPLAEALPVSELLAQLEDFQARGIRSVLLVMDTLGGQVDAAIVLYDALLRFREAGGRIVAFIPKIAGSAGSWLIHAADCTVIAEGAHIILHGSLDLETQQPLPVDPDSAAHQMHLGLYLTRTLTPRDLIERSLRRWRNDRGEPPYAQIDALNAVRGGWADFSGDEVDARRLAELYAQNPGLVIPTPRRELLAASEVRGEHAEWSGGLQFLRTRAGELRSAMRGGWVQRSPETRVALDRLSDMEIDLLCGDSLTLGGVRMPAAVAAGDLRGAEILVERVYFDDRDGSPVGTYHVFEGRVEADASSSGIRLSVESFASVLKGVLIPRNPIQAPCPNQFGDEACGINRSSLALSGAASFGGTNLPSITTSSAAITARPAGYLVNGVLTITSGDCAGQSRTVTVHMLVTGVAAVGLSRPLKGTVAPGDTFSVIPDCAKTIAACDAFGNRPRFRGMPFVDTRGQADATVPIRAATVSMRFNMWTYAATHDEDRDWSTGLPQSFDLEFAPSAITSVRLMGESPYELISGTDYTVSGRTITILSLPVYGRVVIHVSYGTIFQGLELEGNTPELSTIFSAGQSVTVTAGTWTDSTGAARNLDGTYTIASASLRWVALNASWSAALPSPYLQVTVAGA